MKRHWTEFTPEWRPGPMTFWVHRHLDADSWSTASTFDPPKPAPVSGRGYATYFVEIDGVTFKFASLDEFRECIRVLSLKVLPSTRALSAARGTGVGPNSHWLSRLPSRAKPWRYRERATRYL